MYCTLNYTKDIFEILYYIFAILGSFSIVIFLLTYIWNKKKFNHDILIGCNNRYQDILKQKPNWVKPELNILQQYLDLCSDELFYQEKGYIGDNIINDWLDGMILYLPHLIKEENYNNKCKWLDVKENKEIYNYYSRVIATFSFNSEDEYDIFKKSIDSERYNILLKKLMVYSKSNK